VGGNGNIKAIEACASSKTLPVLEHLALLDAHSMEEPMSDTTPGSVLPSFAPKPYRKRFSTLLKMISIAVLALLLLIPLTMVQSVLKERLGRRDAAVCDITSTWGREQIVMGPVLIVPFKSMQKSWKEQLLNGRIEKIEVNEPVRSCAYFLPVEFTAIGKLEPDRLHRGIYETVVYSGTLDISGHFARPSFSEWNVDPQQILWDETEIAISITDLRGAKESLQVKLSDQLIPLKPGNKLKGFQGGVYARIQGFQEQAETIPFKMSLTLNGNRSIRFAPVGVNNDVRLASTWPDPGFQGGFLPRDRKVGPDGFSAHWQVSYYGRSYPQQWTDQAPVDATAVSSSLFGVDLVSILDSYRYVERSIKYGVLFIAILFAAFFLFEVISGARIHAFQYTLVGLALCLFYLGLLALSEVISFGAAYWIGAAASSLMISLYSAKVLHSVKRACIVAVGLALVYAFLFVILRLQDLSLLVGTAGLFLVLAIVMFVTRNIDWYAQDNA
jgi:inner membrane protein